jgi:hypothetical protein
MEKYDIINDEKTLGFKKELITGVLGDQYYSDKYTVYMLENHPLFDITEKKDRVGGMVLDIETLDSTSWISRGVEVNGLLSKFINSVLIHTNLEKGRLMVGRNVKLTNCYIESGWEGDAVIRKSEIENVKIIGRFGGVNIKKSKILGGSFVSTSLEKEWGISIVESSIVSCNIILHDCYLSLNQMNLWNMDIVESEKLLTNADIEEI